ncbi:asparaginase [Actinomadura keratinilytica]|jgi:L-asparaginase II|uniref:Asparaginase n=1 Tax=Actinomadura keratinilytica TaxID=547461 RepID=A0ABP7YKF3_9ACTN
MADLIGPPRHVPLLHVVRGDLVESVHHGSVAVLGPDGRLLYAAGDVETPFFPRSAMKPLQAAGMLRSGLPLDGELLALAAASHSGEEHHRRGVRRILAEAGLGESDLRNTSDLPLDPDLRAQWRAQGRPPSRLAQNCSGKHAAMLLTARLNGWPTADYLDPGHPLQKVIADTVEDLTGDRIARTSADGCGAPLFAVSLHGLTRAYARIAAARDGHLATLAAALRAHPRMLAGRGRDVVRLTAAVPGLLAKDGFEAVMVAALPDGRAVGVKIADGSERARLPVTAAALTICGVDPAALAPFLETAVRGGDAVVGRFEIAGDLARRAAEAATAA